jgi:hypothetical protein
MGFIKYIHKFIKSFAYYFFEVCITAATTSTPGTILSISLNQTLNTTLYRSDTAHYITASASVPINGKIRIFHYFLNFRFIAVNTNRINDKFWQCVQYAKSSVKYDYAAFSSNEKQELFSLLAEQFKQLRKK